jgi:hypothetical protein
LGFKLSKGLLNKAILTAIDTDSGARSFGI